MDLPWVDSYYGSCRDGVSVLATPRQSWTFHGRTVYLVQPIYFDPVPATSILDQLKIGLVCTCGSSENGAGDCCKRVKRQAVHHHCNGEEGRQTKDSLEDVILEHCVGDNVGRESKTMDFVFFYFLLTDRL